MLGSPSLHQLVSCTLLLLVSFSSSGEGRPHVTQEASPDTDGADAQRALLLEAVKTGILSSLGADREPRPAQKASEEDLRKMYQLYREKLREMRGNSSQTTGEMWPSTMSTVLFPATVEPIKVIRRGEQTQSGRRLQWYRAVFRKDPNIQSELTLARAELKISRQVLANPTTAQPETRREIKVRVNRMKPMNSAAWTHDSSQASGNVSSARDATLDISPEVERWMGTDGGQALVVDIGIGVDAFEANPIISLELGLVKPEPARRPRLPRSNKEDDCDERGWCCRKSVTVSFKDIGWSDWVVAPAEYTMHFCDGACPHNYKPASMHTQVKSRLHQISKGETPRPCCVPAAYEPMVLMHYDSGGKLKLTPFEDLIVSACHCA